MSCCSRGVLGLRCPAGPGVQPIENPCQSFVSSGVRSTLGWSSGLGIREQPGAAWPTTGSRRMTVRGDAGYPCRGRSYGPRRRRSTQLVVGCIAPRTTPQPDGVRTVTTRHCARPAAGLDCAGFLGRRRPYPGQPWRQRGERPMSPVGQQPSGSRRPSGVPRREGRALVVRVHDEPGPRRIIGHDGSSRKTRERRSAAPIGPPLAARRTQPRRRQVDRRSAPGPPCRVPPQVGTSRTPSRTLSLNSSVHIIVRELAAEPGSGGDQPLGKICVDRWY